MIATAEQRAVIESKASPLVVLAGPGSGKTSTIIEMANKIGAVEANSTVILTFNNRTGAEIRERLQNVKVLYAGNVHGYLLRLLQWEGIRIGLSRNLTVLDQEGAVGLFSECFNDLYFKGNSKDAQLECRLNPKVLRGALQKMPTHQTDKSAWNVAMLYHDRLIKSGLLDYDSILTYGLELIRKGIKRPPEMLIVDEVQDSSPILWEIYRAFKCRRNMFVGDLDQSIYSWVGACPQELLRVCDKPGVTVMQITHNYRSGAEICTAATRLISYNTERKNKPVIAATTKPSNIFHAEYPTETAELSGVGVWAQKQISPDAAILCRDNKSVRLVKDCLVAYHVKVQGRVEKPADLGKAMALLAACNDPSNDELVYACAKRFYGVNQAKEHKRAAASQMRPMAAKVEDMFPDEWFTVSGQTITMLVEPGDRIVHLLAFLEEAGFPEACVDYITTIAEDLEDSPTLSELILACSEDIDEFTSEGIAVLTMHRAKGLEWESVLLPFWTEGIFPRYGASEEERRLAFVAVTRAKSQVMITSSALAVVGYGSLPSVTEPSSYIRELGL